MAAHRIRCAAAERFTPPERESQQPARDEQSSGRFGNRVTVQVQGQVPNRRLARAKRCGKNGPADMAVGIRQAKEIQVARPGLIELPDAERNRVDRDK
jgi:hypothetical protein